MPGGNAISPINADEFFAASKELLSREPLRNVDAKNLARAKVYPLTTYSGEPIKEPRLIYPYGEYDHDTVKIIRNLGCICAFKADPLKNYKFKNRLFELPRFDTNDFLF